MNQQRLTYEPRNEANLADSQQRLMVINIQITNPQAISSKIISQSKNTS